jgi:hypothetical protein
LPERNLSILNSICDYLKSDIECRTGEFVIDTLESVEDSKGNSGDSGRLIITNLRLIWHSHEYPKINLCKFYLFSFHDLKFYVEILNSRWSFVYYKCFYKNS